MCPLHKQQDVSKMKKQQFINILQEHGMSIGGYVIFRGGGGTHIYVHYMYVPQ